MGLRPLFSSARDGTGVVMAYRYTSDESLNSKLPANIRYKVNPRDQMSTLLVLCFDMSSISGAM